jgi:DNA-binding IclR family transcriptional regulator
MERPLAFEGRAGSPNRTLEKGLLLLGLFDMDHPDWSLRELREQSGLSKTTTLRLVKTLESLDYLTCEPRTGRYHLGSSILRAVYVSLSYSELVRTVHPFLEALAEETTETAAVTVWTDRGPLLVDMVLTSRIFKPQLWLGMLLPGLGSAAARVLVAFNHEAIMEAALSKTQVASTPFTVTDQERLREELGKVKREGVSLELKEWDLSMGAVAAPVLGPDDLVRAGLSVVVPIERCGEREMQAYTEAVKRTADSISHALRPARRHAVQLSSPPSSSSSG